MPSLIFGLAPVFDNSLILNDNVQLPVNLPTDKDTYAQPAVQDATRLSDDFVAVAFGCAAIVALAKSSRFFAPLSTTSARLARSSLCNRVKS